MDDPRIAALETTITPHGWSGELEVLSAIDGRIQNGGVPRYRGFASRHLAPVDDGAWADDSVQVTVETTNRTSVSPRRRGPGSSETTHPFRSPAGWWETRICRADTDRAGRRRGTGAGREGGRPRHFTPRPSPRPVSERTWVSRAGDFDELLRSHVQAWDHIWHRCELRVEGLEGQGRSSTCTSSTFCRRCRSTAALSTLGFRPWPPRGGVPRSHLLGRTVHLSLPQLSLSGADPGVAPIPVSPSSRKRWAARGRLPRCDVSLAERQQRSRGEPVGPSQPEIGKVDPRQLSTAATHRTRRRLQRVAVLPGHRRPRFPRRLRSGDADRDRPFGRAWPATTIRAAVTASWG